MSQPKPNTAQLYFRPSWFSLLVSIALSLTIVIGTIVISHYNGSVLQKQLFDFRATQDTATITGDYDSIGDDISDNSLVSNLPLLFFWGLVGVAVYSLTINITSTLGNAVTFRKELGYVHANRSKLMRAALSRFVFRLGAVAAEAGLTVISLHQLLPYAIAVSHASSINLISLGGAGYSLLALTVVMLTAYVHTVLLRLVFLKPRIFSKYPFVQ